VVEEYENDTAILRYRSGQNTISHNALRNEAHLIDRASVGRSGSHFPRLSCDVRFVCSVPDLSDRLVAVWRHHIATVLSIDIASHRPSLHRPSIAIAFHHSHTRTHAHRLSHFPRTLIACMLYYRRTRQHCHDRVPAHPHINTKP
jgi:hypothetical protein